MASPCSKCHSKATWSRHEHFKCPMRPARTSAYAFKTGLTRSARGVPEPKPCPACGTAVPWKSWHCEKCGHGEENASGDAVKKATKPAKKQTTSASRRRRGRSAR